MSTEEKQMLGKILRWALPRFFGGPSEDAYELLISCEERVSNLGLLEICGVYYTTF